MSVKRFFLSWILSSIVMFILFFIWHGVILNDFSRLSYPKSIFLIFSAITYIIVGLVVTKVVYTKFYDHLLSSPVLKGLLKGAFCGVIFFLTARLVGASFSMEADTKNLAMDFVWQLIEQGIGGIVVGIVCLYHENSVLEEN